MQLKRVGQGVAWVVFSIAAITGIHNWAHPLRIVTKAPAELPRNDYLAMTNTASAYATAWLTYSPNSTGNPELQTLGSGSPVPQAGTTTQTVQSTFPLKVAALGGHTWSVTVGALVTDRPAATQNNPAPQPTQQAIAVSVPVAANTNGTWAVVGSPAPVAWPSPSGTPPTPVSSLQAASLSTTSSQYQKISGMLQSFFQQYAQASSPSGVANFLAGNAQGIQPLNGTVSFQSMTFAIYGTGTPSYTVQATVNWQVQATGAQIQSTYWITVIPQGSTWAVQSLRS